MPLRPLRGRKQIFSAPVVSASLRPPANSCDPSGIENDLGNLTISSRTRKRWDAVFDSPRRLRVRLTILGLNRPRGVDEEPDDNAVQVHARVNREAGGEAFRGDALGGVVGEGFQH